MLILRSPWHNGLVSGAVAWAMLIVGGRNSVTGAVEETSYVFDALGRLVDYDGQAAYTYDTLNRVATRNQVPFAYAGLDVFSVSHPSLAGAASLSRDNPQTQERLFR